MKTESDAKRCWCPFARTQRDGNALDSAANASTTKRNPEWARCIGSDCMAWRWGAEEKRTHIDTIERRGHCGLAGRDGQVVVVMP